MTFIPEWAPNVHPLFVHFPIVLLVLAPFMDLGAILLRKQEWLSKSANFLYFLAGISVAVVFITGKYAADTIDIPTQAFTTISTHANWAFYTLVFAGIHGMLRAFMLFRKNGSGRVRWFWVIPGLLGAVLLFLTADQGAKLVFAHGVGVSVEQQEQHHKMEAKVIKDEESQEHSHTPEKPLNWSASKNSVTDLKHRFNWILSGPDSMGIATTKDEQGSSVSIHLDEQEAMFVFPELVTNLELQVLLNRDLFNGVVRLVHHVSDETNYDFLELDGSVIRLGRINDGKLQIFDSTDFTADGWVNVKSVGTKGHFRGYFNQNLLTHGHAADLSAGKMGLYIQGSGVIKLAELKGTLIE